MPTYTVAESESHDIVAKCPNGGIDWLKAGRNPKTQSALSDPVRGHCVCRPAGHKVDDQVSRQPPVHVLRSSGRVKP
jgi:hypothetical protein